MIQITPEIDALLWAVAEDGKPESVLEFETRHPHLTKELFRRIAMVADLKNGRSSGPRAHLPQFVLRQPKPVASPQAVFAAGTLILAAVGIASYTVTTAMWPTVAAKPKIKSEVPVAVGFNIPAEKKVTELVTEPNKTTPPIQEPAKTDTSPPESTPAYLKPQNLKINRALLQDAIRLIAAQGGLTVVIAPGMPNPEIAVEYQQQSIIDMLKDLGKQYAFSSFDQHDGSVLVIPAVDENAPVVPKAEPDSNRNRRLGG